MSAAAGAVGRPARSWRRPTWADDAGDGPVVAPLRPRRRRWGPPRPPGRHPPAPGGGAQGPWRSHPVAHGSRAGGGAPVTGVVGRPGGPQPRLGHRCAAGLGRHGATGNGQERPCRLVGRPRRPSRPPPPSPAYTNGAGVLGPTVATDGLGGLIPMHWEVPPPAAQPSLGLGGSAARRAAPDGQGLEMGTVPCRTRPTRTPLPRPPPGTGQWL